MLNYLGKIDPLVFKLMFKVCEDVTETGRSTLTNYPDLSLYFNWLFFRTTKYLKRCEQVGFLTMKKGEFIMQPPKGFTQGRNKAKTNSGQWLLYPNRCILEGQMPTNSQLPPNHYFNQGCLRTHKPLMRKKYNVKGIL